MSSVAVKLTLLGELARAMGWREAAAKQIVTEDSSIRKILADIATESPVFRDKVYNPHTDSLHEEVVILVNGRNIVHLDNLDTIVANNSEVAVFYPFGGG